MEVTRSTLERIIGGLKRRGEFSFGDPALNGEWDEVDVFVGVADAEVAGFSPAEEGAAEAFLLWSRAADGAFAADGALTRPLPMIWGGSRNAIQLAFARSGLTIRIDFDAEAREGYEASGTLVVSPRSADETCALRRLLAAFGELEARDVIALARAGRTQSSGWESVGERERDAQQTAVFWHDQNHDDFDGLGQIAGTLHLYWRGDAGLVAQVLEGAGFTVTRPSSRSQAIEVADASTPPAIETYAAALAANPAAPPEPAEASRAPAGPLAELHRYRAPTGTKPVQRLAFDPAGAALAVAQVSDRRGGPDHVLCRIDATTGEVTRTFAPLSRVSASCGGCVFLADGRLVFSFYDFLPHATPGSVQAAARLLVWEPAGDAVRELAVHPLSHVCNVSLASVDAAGEHVAVVTATGAAILEVGPPGAPTWQESARVGGPPVDAYPIVALSPDGRRVVWTSDAASEVRCVERADGRVLWRENLFAGHSGGRATRGLLFDPRGEHLLALCLRSVYGETRGGRTDVAEDRRLQGYALSDGRRTLAAFEAATAGLTCLAWHPDGERAAFGTAEGEVVLVAYPGGARLASQRVFARGGTTALAFDREGLRLAVGSEKGEIAVLSLAGG